MTCTIITFSVINAEILVLFKQFVLIWFIESSGIRNGRAAPDNVRS